MSTPASTIKSSRLQDLIEKIRKQKEGEAGDHSTAVTASKEPAKIQEPSEDPSSFRVIDRYGKEIILNDKQSEFVKLAGTEGKSAVLIGAAGCGKSTTQYAVTQELIQSGRAGILLPDGHRHLIEGTPGILICAYTRRAVNNIRKNLPKDLQSNAITVHKLLEYQPVYDSVIDETTGEEKTKMSFVATRNAANPLSPTIHTIIIEEASMLGTSLHQEIINACPHNPQFIYLGDIQQLPPVFGPAILGFKLLELPVIELTEVYRQALESPIISLAHRILSGKGIEAKEFPSWKHPSKLTLHPWKKKIDAENALNTAVQFFCAAASSGVYDPEEDIILVPFNKSFGTVELNNGIANHLARRRSARTYQVIAGFNKIHLSIGDKILYDKEDAVILSIEPNPAYSGARPVPDSLTLDYWGYDPEASATSAAFSESDMDFLLSQVSSTSSADEDSRVRQASHTVTVRMLDSETVIKLDKASELNGILLGYALTVHKSQGSEWRKVFFVLHQSHATMISRELLYTAVTRAREELYVICEPESFVKGIQSQRVKGNTLAEKSEYFKGKLEAERN